MKRDLKNFISLYVDDEVFEKVEKARGKTKRSTFIEEFLRKGVGEN